MKAAKQVTIRELMPRGYTAILARKTGRPKSYIVKVVGKEVTGSPIWEEVLKLAAETKKQRKKEAAELQALKSVA